MATMIQRIRGLLGSPRAGHLVPHIDSIAGESPEQAGGSSSGIVNPFAAIGAASDSASQGRPNMIRRRLSHEELTAAYRDGLYGRLCDLIPAHATRKGWQIDGPDSEDIAQRLRELGATEVLRSADVWGQCYGESRVLLVTDDPLPKTAPLPLRLSRGVKALHVLDAREFQPVRWCTDMSNPLWGQPEIYRITPRRAGLSGTMEVHASRLLRFFGNPVPPSARIENEVTYDGADALAQRIWDGLRAVAQTSAAGERLALELSVAVFQIDDLLAKSGADTAEDFLGVMKLINMTKSVANAVLLGQNDTYQRVQANPSGFKDLSESARLYLGALVGFPLVEVFGMTPGGLNSDGNSWRTHLYQTVGHRQEQRYHQPLETVIDLLYRERTGDRPPPYTLAFRPLGEVTEVEQAQIRLTNAQADAAYAGMGILSANHIRHYRFGPDGYQDIGPDPDVDVDERDLDERVAELLGDTDTEGGEHGAAA